MTDFEFGDVILVPFPFTDLGATKKRPAVIVSSAAYHAARPDAILMAITSQVRNAPRVGERVVEYWKEAGLLKPSMIKPVVATIERELAIRKLGRLQEADRVRLLECLRESLSLS